MNQSELEAQFKHSVDVARIRYLKPYVVDLIMKEAIFLE